jgi:hypothetical protein
MASADKQPAAGDTAKGGTRKAGAFDIRVFIGSLIGIYGVVLVLMGLFGTTDSQLAKSDDLNINLWAGLGMVVVAAFFFVWARLRPVIVPADPDAPAVNDA